jgi:DNA-directed RNA polymerase subunit K/omega
METEVVISDESHITPVEQRRTSHFLTKFEVAKVIAFRAKQLTVGAPFPAHLPGQMQRKRVSSMAEWELRGEYFPAPDGLTIQEGLDTKSLLRRTDPVTLAKQELAAGCLPFLIKRSYNGGQDSECIPLWELKYDPLWLSFS